ncbi:MAG TPA: hypothetical protein VM933_02695 [Acidimicrobiales bacterium]|nr:hypothetical protein [Acidimicrobiales bacterium]
MPAAVSILTPLVTAAPGGAGVAQVLIRNTGTVVDQFAVNLVGDASAWARPVPPALSLFPGAEQTIEIHFSPPRSSVVVAGSVPYGVRVTSKEDTDFSIVEEGEVTIAGFAQIEAKVVPRTSEGKRSAVHRVEITNTGNAVVTADVSASDPDELLAFDLDPDTVEIQPGQTEIVKLKVAAKKSQKGRSARRMPFTVFVEPGGPTVQVDANFEQKPKASLLLFVAILVLLGVLVYLVQDQAGALPL